MTPDLPGARHKPERIHSAGQTATETRPEQRL
jgi:hypothetical protein